MKINKIYKDFTPPPPRLSKMRCETVRFPSICTCACCRYTQPEWCELNLSEYGVVVFKDGLPLSEQQIERAVAVLGYDNVDYLSNLINRYRARRKPLGFSEYIRITRWSLEPEEMDTEAIRQAAYAEELKRPPGTSYGVKTKLRQEEFEMFLYALENQYAD